MKKLNITITKTIDGKNDCLQIMDDDHLIMLIAEDIRIKDDRLEDVSICYAGLSTRAVNCLRNINIETLQDLAGRTELSMAKIKYIGVKTFKEVKEVLVQHGLDFLNHDRVHRWNEWKNGR